MIRVSAIHSAERVLVEFAYFRELAPGERVTAVASVTAEDVASGAAAPDLIDGAASVGADALTHVADASVYQWVRGEGGQAGAGYIITCVALTSAGARLVRQCVLPVRDFG